MTQTVTQFSARSVPWAKIGTTIEKPVTAEKAMKLAGLDFDVTRRPISFPGSDGKPIKLAGRQVLAREDNDMHVGIVADAYEIVQYRDAFTFVNEIHPMVVAAGQLRGGRQAFMVVRVPDHDTVTVLDGDAHDLYAVLRTSHDCSRAVELTIMPVRGMCMNQMPLGSFTTRAQQRWSIKHVRGVHDKIREATRIVKGLDEYAREYATVADHLAQMDLEIAEARKIMEMVLPNRPKRAEAIGAIVGLFESSDTVGYHNTGWGLVNAVGEYFDHGRRGGQPEAQLLNALGGVTTKSINRTAQVLLRHGGGR
jgi:phage/plasmid-like protein (TIGR03299 family)